MLINGLMVCDYQAAISSLPILITPIASHYRYHRVNQYHSLWYLCAHQHHCSLLSLLVIIIARQTGTRINKWPLALGMAYSHVRCRKDFQKPIYGTVPQDVLWFEKAKKECFWMKHINLGDCPYKSHDWRISNDYHLGKWQIVIIISYNYGYRQKMEAILSDILIIIIINIMVFNNEWLAYCHHHL